MTLQSIEYRSDLCPGITEPFLITEYGVFAIGADGEEALVLYGDLSDYPDTAVPLKYGGCVRRYPVTVTVGPKAGASLGYPAGAWATHEDVGEAVAAHSADEAAHPHLMGLYAELRARVALVELMYGTQIKDNPFTVAFNSLDGVRAEGVWNAAQARLEF